MSRDHALTVVGYGPKHRSTLRRSSSWSARLCALAVNADVDVLLDSGEIVRTTLRGLRDDGPDRPRVWVVGIVGSYHASRIRPADGWWRTRGVVRADLMHFATGRTELTDARRGDEYLRLPVTECGHAIPVFRCGNRFVRELGELLPFTRDDWQALSPLQRERCCPACVRALRVRLAIEVPRA